MADEMLQHRIIKYLNAKPKKTENLYKLCQVLCVPKTCLNQQLYRLKKNGRLIRVQQSPPVWTLKEAYLGQPGSHNQNAGINTSTRPTYPRGFVKGYIHKKKFHKAAFHRNVIVPKRYETPPDRPVYHNTKEARCSGVSENIATLYHDQSHACMVRFSEKLACQSPGAAHYCDDDDGGGTVAGDFNKDSFQRSIFTDEFSSTKSSTVRIPSLSSLANYESADNETEFVMDTDKDRNNPVNEKLDFNKEYTKEVCSFRAFVGLHENSCDSTNFEKSGNDDNIKGSTLPEIEGFSLLQAQSIQNKSNAPANLTFILGNDGSGTLNENVLLTNQASLENNKQADLSDIDDCIPVLKILKGYSGMTYFSLKRQVPLLPDNRLEEVLKKCVSLNFVKGSLKLWKITTAGKVFLNNKEIRHEADIFQGSCQANKQQVRTYSGRPPSPRTILKATEALQTTMSTSASVVVSSSSLANSTFSSDMSQLQQSTMSSHKSQVISQPNTYKTTADIQVNASVINVLTVPQQSVDSMQGQAAGFDSSVSLHSIGPFRNTSDSTVPQMFLKCESPLKKNMARSTTQDDLLLITAGSDSNVILGQQVMFEKPEVNEVKYRTLSHESRNISVSSRSFSWPTMRDIPGEFEFADGCSRAKHFKRVARSYSTDGKPSGSQPISGSEFVKNRQHSPIDLIDSLKKTSISSTEQSFSSKTTNQHNSLNHLLVLQSQTFSNSISLTEDLSPYDQNHSSANAPQSLLSFSTGSSFLPAKIESGSSRPVCGPPVPPGKLLEFRQLTPQSCAPRQPNALALSLSTESFNALNKNPVSALMEYAQMRKMVATVMVISQKGTSHNPIFEMAAFVGDRKFPSVMCNNKKDAKKEACDIALRQLAAEGQFHAGNIQNAVPLNNMTHFDKIASLTHRAFTALVSQITTESFAGRKVIAGLVMKRSEDDTGVLVSLGTGNRCITGQQLSLQGNTVNDSHAEIITRRGFIRFLYKQLMEFNPSKNHPLFEISQHGKLQIRGNISFHLYISTAPCGDGALFSPRDADSSKVPVDQRIRPPHEPTFSSTVQGLLRTKVEGGEGTIPVEPGFTGQTFDGILRGERLLTMSCTDKICRWNVVGMQGALLSHFLEPVYLDSLTLGLLYDHGHLSRAVCCRVGQSEPDIHSLLPQGYRLNHPWLGRVTVCDPPREVQKTKSLSINWCFGDKGPEVTDGTQGLCCTSIEQRLFSRCSKRNLFDNYKALCEKFGRNDLLNVNSYNEAKASATDFVSARQALIKKCKDNGLGKWVSKPIEEDMFSWEEQT